MKKSFDEIRGTVLTDKQMKSLIGGTVIGGPNPCASSSCPTNRSWTCAANKLGNCRCNGVVSPGAETQWADCTSSTAPSDTTKGK